MAVEMFFSEKFNKSPLLSGFVPYRICTLGAHIDHQLGHINGFAIDRGMSFAYSPSEKVRIYSADFPGKAEFDVKAVPEKTGTWQDYAASALWSLKNGGYDIKNGFDGAIEGSMPVGGLSSSAAVTILYINAFCKVNGISLNEKELITLAHRAEREYIGLKCGTLDQSCEVLCRKNNLLHIDTLDGTAENIPAPVNMKNFGIAVFFSGLEHSLVNSDYNRRTEELKSACLFLKEKAGLPTEGTADVLREVPYEIYESYGKLLPLNERKRCEHFYSENERAIKGTELFRKGDIEGYGKLVTESGYSSIYNYEAGSPELKALYDILREQKGVYGTRFSGAGFKGCCLALIDPDYKESIKSITEEKYLALFPEHKEKYSCTFCNTADGFGGTK